MSIQTLGSSPKAEFSWDEMKEIKCLTFHAPFSQVTGAGVSEGSVGVGSVDEADFAAAAICSGAVRILMNSFLRSSSDSTAYEEIGYEIAKRWVETANAPSGNFA